MHVIEASNKRRTIPYICVTREDIIDAIKTISQNSSGGLDEFPAILLKQCSKSLAHPLQLLYKASLKTGEIPINKGKIFYGQEPPSGESTTTECGVNYQLLAVMY